MEIKNSRWYFQERLTSRKRPKSVLYLRLKKREIFKIVESAPFGLFETPVCWKKNWGTIWRLQKNFEKNQKIEIFEQSSQSAEKC